MRSRRKIQRDFTHTRQALALFDADTPRRQALWDSVIESKDVYAAQQEDRNALAKVQKAFFEDTRDINSPDRCLLLTITDIRQMIGGSNA